MKLFSLLLTGAALFGFTSCGTAAENSIFSNEVSAVLVSETNKAASAAEDGAVSSPYSYMMQDIRNLQDFLLTKPAEDDLTGKPYDLNGDGKWNAVDLTLMKRELPPVNDSETLVIYFSRTGNTEKIAQYLIELTGADSYVIEAAVPYTDADIKYQDDNCRANKEQNDKTVRPEIANPIASIDSYDTIFLGYPI